jgi:hypothetical protein
MTTARSVPVIAFSSPEVFPRPQRSSGRGEIEGQAPPGDAGTRAFEHEFIGFPGEDVFPRECFISDLQRDVVSVRPQSEWLFFHKAVSLVAEGKFAELTMSQSRP